jgi:hypothetical protein
VPTDRGDPRRSSFGRDYWLRRCEGFRVESPAGRIGTVGGVRFGASSQPHVLEVRAGLLSRRLLLLPVHEVEEIIPEEERIILRASPELLDSVPTAD